MKRIHLNEINKKYVYASFIILIPLLISSLIVCLALPGLGGGMKFILILLGTVLGALLIGLGDAFKNLYIQKIQILPITQNQ